MTPTIEEERNAALLGWYRESGRSLPWRDTAEPYPVLVSEIMLQQTRADRVAAYFERFMDHFPTVEALAAAPFADVAAEWSGLGYNVRAKRLHEAARRIAAEGWPESIDGLMTLPGVGPYTAHAVGAIAFGAPTPAVDTNLRRVLIRWHGEVLEGRRLERAASIALGDADASAWNQAMMDLGATVCLPRTPKCADCPVDVWCAGPDTYQPPRPQARFEGSLRQVRGAIVRRLVTGPATFAELVSTARAEPMLVAEAVDALTADAMITKTPTGYTLT